MNAKLYANMQGFLRGMYRLFAPIRASGLDHMPAEGPVILCANHQSMTDPMAVYAIIDRPVRFIAKKELFAFKPMGALLRGMGAFPVDRGASDLSAIRASLGVLKEGGVLGIFPEGKRAYKGDGSFLPGVSLIALRSRATVIPMRIFYRARLFRKTVVSMGPAVDLSAYYGKTDSRIMAEATDAIRRAVFALEEPENS